MCEAVNADIGARCVVLTGDHIEGVCAVLEKRPADFTGR